MPDQYNQPNNPAPYGYNPQTGQPNPAPQMQPQITGYDPQTGQPIYAQPQMQPQPQITGYDPQTGQPIYAQQQPQPQPQIMGYDPQTGQPIYAQPGQPQQPVYPQPPVNNIPQPPTKAPKTPKKGLIGIISAVAVAAIACFVIFVWPKPFSGKGGSGSSKSGPVESAIENTGKALIGSSDIGSFLVDQSEKKSKNTGIDLRVTDIGSLVSTFSGDNSYSMISGEGGMTFVVSGDGKKASVSAAVSIMGMAYSAVMYYDEDGITLAIPELLSNTYFIPFDNIEEEMAGSIFNPNSGSQYAMDQSSYDQMIQAIQAISKLKEAMPSGDETFGDISEKLEAQGLKPEFQTTNGSFTVDGEELNGTIATLDLDTEKMVQYVDFAKSYVNEYVGKLQQSIPELSGDLNMEDLDEFIQELRNDNICAHIELDIYKNYLVAMDIEIYDSANRTENSAHIIGEFGKDPKTSNHTSFRLVRGTSEEYARVDYNVTDNTDSHYACNISVTAQGNPAFNASFDWDKTTGAFYLDAMGMVTINGTAKVEGSKMTLSLGQVSAMGQSVDLSAIQIAVDGDAKLEKPSGSAKNIFKLTDSDIQSIMTELQSNLGALAGFMG